MEKHLGGVLLNAGYPEPIEIIDIGPRAVTGVSSRPFRCEDADGTGWYVKLGNALPKERLYEIVFGFLAEQMGLPVPERALVHVPKELSLASAMDTAEFGFGLGFASREIFHAMDVGSTEAENIPPELQANLLLFDWWIRNEDRKLGGLGGNSNLLLSPSGEFFLIDHGNALDPEFDESAFFNEHSCASGRSLWVDSQKRCEWIEKGNAAVEAMNAAWNTLPQEWLDWAQVAPEDINNQLINFETESFWSPFDA